MTRSPGGHDCVCQSDTFLSRHFPDRCSARIPDRIMTVNLTVTIVSATVSVWWSLSCRTVLCRPECRTYCLVSGLFSCFPVSGGASRRPRGGVLFSSVRKPVRYASTRPRHRCLGGVEGRCDVREARRRRQNQGLLPPRERLPELTFRGVAGRCRGYCAVIAGDIHPYIDRPDSALLTTPLQPLFTALPRRESRGPRGAAAPASYSPIRTAISARGGLVPRPGRRRLEPVWSWRVAGAGAALQPASGAGLRRGGDGPEAERLELVSAAPVAVPLPYCHSPATSPRPALTTPGARVGGWRLGPVASPASATSLVSPRGRAGSRPEGPSGSGWRPQTLNGCSGGGRESLRFVSSPAPGRGASGGARGDAGALPGSPVGARGTLVAASSEELFPGPGRSLALGP